MREWTIYTLSDPNTGAIRYVGKTKDTARRLRTHRTSMTALRERQADVAAGRVALSYGEIAKACKVPKSSVIAAERRWLT